MKIKKLIILIIVVFLIAASVIYYKYYKNSKKLEIQAENNADIQDNFPAGEKDYTRDFNFDGVNDLSIHTSNSGGYGGPTYAVYLNNPKTSKYIYNKEISELVSMQGMFDLDKNNKVITIYTKDGCCSHTTEEYLVNEDNSLTKIYTKTENVDFEKQSKENTYLKITESKLVNGKWFTTNSTKIEKNTN